MNAFEILQLVGILLVVFVIRSVKIVQPGHRGLVERLGSWTKTLDSGIHFVIPLIEKLQRIDVRERIEDIPPQQVITKDNVSVTVDALVYYEIADPAKYRYNVADANDALAKLAQTSLRNFIGDLALDESLISREGINSKLRESLLSATQRWGIKLMRVEIQRIDPPPAVVEAMQRQMKAERERRGRILEADGSREAQIREAEGRAEAIKRVAEAKRFERTTLAEGKAAAIRSVYTAINESRPTPELIALQYLEGLQRMANGSSNTVFIPYEASAMLSSLGSVKTLLQGPQAPAIPVNSKC